MWCGALPRRIDRGVGLRPASNSRGVGLCPAGSFVGWGSAPSVRSFVGWGSAPPIPVVAHPLSAIECSDFLVRLGEVPIANNRVKH